MKLSYCILLIISFIFISCTKDDEVAWVSFQNDTDYEVNIEFFSNPNAYRSKGIATLDTLSKTWVDVYDSVDEGIDPCKLLSLGYDSIIIYITNPEESTIYIGKNSVTNYIQNPFKESGCWKHEVFIRDFPTNRDLNKTTIHNHIFSIDSKNIIKEISY